MKYALGIDIGGTNIKALAVSPTGRALAELSAPTCDTGDKTWLVNVAHARELIEKEMRAKPNWMGVAAPGLAARNQQSIGHMPGRLAGLEGLVWRKFFKFPGAVPVLNDAQATLLGEVWRGAARKSQNTILLTLGTGVGGAAMVDGRLLRGHLGRAGHLGHTSLDPFGSPDIVGAPGSLEDAIGDCTIKARSAGRFSSTQEMLSAMRRGNREAREIWRRSLQILAAALASFINILDPELVVIGGGIAGAGKALFVPLGKQLAQFEWRPDGARVRVVPAKLGGRAGAYGAACNALQFQQ